LPSWPVVAVREWPINCHSMGYSNLIRYHFKEPLTNRCGFPILAAVLFVMLIQSGCVAPGNLAVSPTNLNFGKVPIGSSSSQSVTITNSSDAIFTITRASITGRGFGLKAPSLPMTLAAGQSATFTTTFAPAAAGNSSGSVLIARSQVSSTQLQSVSTSATQSVPPQQTVVTMTGSGVPVTPSITAQPASQTVMAGQIATFIVTASGEAPIEYQWLKNGTPISGATSPSYNTPATTASDSGSQFTVVVGNSTGTVTSSAALLTVTVAGQLRASTTNLNFGKITVGSGNILPVTLTNTGSISISVSNVAISGAGVSTGGVSSGLTLAAGNSAVLNVTFAPSAAGALNGSVTLASNATNPMTTISLSGDAVQPVSHSVTLSFAPNSSNVTGYNIYRSSTSSGPYTKLNSPLITSTTYTDTAVLASETYFYVGTSVDSAGDETADSNQVSATIPVF
jgi:hypothetical protein